MDIPVLKDLIQIDNKHELVKLYYYINYVSKGEDITNSELDIISHLYETGGYNSKENCKKFLEDCVNLGYKKSAQSVRNSLSKLTKAGILKKIGNNTRNVADTKLPTEGFGTFGLEYFITNLKIKNEDNP